MSPQGEAPRKVWVSMEDMGSVGTERPQAPGPQCAEPVTRAPGCDHASVTEPVVSEDEIQSFF